MDEIKELIKQELEVRKSKQESEKKVEAKIVDKSGDIHDLPFSERIKFLDKIPESEHIKKSKRILCHSEEEVRKALAKVSKEEGSEGGYLKLSTFSYFLTGRTTENIKFKNEISLDAVVLKKNKVAKTERTFYYHCGLKSDSEMVYCGKTLNTNIDAKEGDIIKVIFVDISGYTDPTTKKRFANWWAPRVSMLRTDKKEPDTIDTAWKMVKATTGRFAEKKMPDIKNLEQLELAAKGKRFVLQHHFRGASEHIDFRVQINHVLEGFTIAAQHKDILKDELAKHWKLEKSADMYSLYWDNELAYQLDKKEKITKEPSATLKKKIFAFHFLLHKGEKYWKVDLHTGEEKKRKGTEEEQVEKIFCVKKGKEPYEWLDVEGVTKPREIEPEPGGSRFYPGIFVKVDEGVYYQGANKPYFKEFFLEGKKWKDRFVFRLVAGLKGTKAVANWLYWKPDSQSPYVLSSRAIKDNWFPPEGESAMSPEWERKLPSELQFWKVDKSKRAEVRKLARKYLLQKKTLSAESSAEFILTNRNWAGQVVVRALPFEDFHLKINGKKFHLDKDPTRKIPDSGISALEFVGKEGYFLEGKKAPKTEVNPNLKIPAYIEKLDSGAVEIIADEPLYLHLRFKGEKMKGLYSFRKTSKQSQFWSFKKGMQSFSVEAE